MQASQSLSRPLHSIGHRRFQHHIDAAKARAGGELDELRPRLVPPDRDRVQRKIHVMAATPNRTFGTEREALQDFDPCSRGSPGSARESSASSPTGNALNRVLGSKTCAASLSEPAPRRPLPAQL